MIHVALAVGAAVVAVAFALSTFDRWRLHRRPYELAWTIAFAFFAVAAAFLAAGAQTGWTGFTFRGFYLFGAILNVAFLGLGEVMLLKRGRPAGRWSGAVAAFALFSTGVLVSTPFTAPLPADELAQGSDVFNPLPRILAVIGSGLGALVVFAGSLYSALRRPSLRNVSGNLLIALGTATSGASGLLNSVFDHMTAFAVTLTLGISLIFLGFLVLTSAVSRVGEDQKEKSAAPLKTRNSAAIGTS